MWLKLKDESGAISLVNIANAQSCNPVKLEDGTIGLKVVWQYDTYKDLDEDLPDSSCVYSEQLFSDITIKQLEMLLDMNNLLLVGKVKQNGQSTIVAKAAPAVKEEPPAPVTKTPAPKKKPTRKHGVDSSELPEVE